LEKVFRLSGTAIPIDGFRVRRLAEPRVLPIAKPLYLFAFFALQAEGAVA
jgi:hypothetical protein